MRSAKHVSLTLAWRQTDQAKIKSGPPDQRWDTFILGLVRLSSGEGPVESKPKDVRGAAWKQMGELKGAKQTREMEPG